MLKGKKKDKILFKTSIPCLLPTNLVKANPCMVKEHFSIMMEILDIRMRFVNWDVFLLGLGGSQLI